MEHEAYMRRALELGAEAMAAGEVPVGCVVVWEGQIVGEGRNRREEDGDALAHAEVLAIRQANAALGGWRLHKASLYVTLEPCPMCAGAILNARIPQVFYGARDARLGACGSVLNLFEEGFGPPPQLTGGLLEDECAALLQEFFRRLRRRRRGESGENYVNFT